MITASKLAIAIAVAGPLAAATVGQSFATPVPPVRSQLKRRRQRRRLTCSIGRMSLRSGSLIAPTEAIHTRTEATHTGTPPLPIGIPTPGIPGMVIIEMARPSTITGIFKSDAKL